MESHLSGEKMQNYMATVPIRRLKVYFGGFGGLFSNRFYRVFPSLHTNQNVC